MVETKTKGLPAGVKRRYVTARKITISGPFKRAVSYYSPAWKSKEEKRNKRPMNRLAIK